MEEEKTEKGWLGAPKGMYQVLYERGFIDPALDPKLYKASAPKAWYDKDGNLKEQHKQDAERLLLPALMQKCEDFVREVSALEDLCRRLSNSTSTVTLLFSPKYHCELAGLGIELAWGYSKQYYQRKMTLEEKKQDFHGCVDRALKAVTKDHARKFCHRTR